MKHPETENYSCTSFVDNLELCDQLINCDTSLLLSTDNNVNSNESTNVSTAISSSTSNTTPPTLEYALKQIKLFQQKLEHKDIEVKQIKQQLENANKVLRKFDKTKKTLMNRIRRFRSTNRLRIENTLLQSTELLHKVFNNDQIEWLQSKSSKRRVYRWSETIKRNH